ncbi:MAG: NUDIX hydrolase [Alphaproteobacteria bacterium]|nr:NUDIX hydrolase [Alphaproteobacteria bacterium]
MIYPMENAGFLWQHARMDKRPQIADFLASCPPLRLGGLVGEAYTKAGVVPFMRGEDGLRFYAMKPRAKRPDLPPPEFQLCKGTRMTQEDGQWRDMRDGEVSTELSETLAETALREAMEEIGLVLANVTALFDVGGYDFASAASGKSKKMWLFATEVASAENFTDTEASTAERGWFTLDEFALVGRADHHEILREIARLL